MIQEPVLDHARAEERVRLRAADGLPVLAVPQPAVREHLRAPREEGVLHGHAAPEHQHLAADTIIADRCAHPCRRRARLFARRDAQPLVAVPFPGVTEALAGGVDATEHDNALAPRIVRHGRKEAGGRVCLERLLDIGRARPERRAVERDAVGSPTAEEHDLRISFRVRGRGEIAAEAAEARPATPPIALTLAHHSCQRDVQCGEPGELGGAGFARTWAVRIRRRPRRGLQAVRILEAAPEHLAGEGCDPLPALDRAAGALVSRAVEGARDEIGLILRAYRGLLDVAAGAEDSRELAPARIANDEPCSRFHDLLAAH